MGDKPRVVGKKKLIISTVREVCKSNRVLCKCEMRADAGEY